jgi:HK97 gp10 family phage protein
MVGDPQQVLRVMSRNIDTLSTVEPYRIAKAVEVYAKEFVPKDTWHLHDNIRAEGHRVVADTEYAWYVEYGTKKMKEQPYMRPAIEAAKQLFDTTSVTAAFGAGM